MLACSYFNIKVLLYGSHTTDINEYSFGTYTNRDAN